MQVRELIEVFQKKDEKGQMGYVILPSSGEYEGLTEEERTYFFQFNPRVSNKLFLSSYTDNQYPHHDVATRNLQLDMNTAVEDTGLVSFMLLQYCGGKLSVSSYPTWKEAYIDMKKRLAMVLDIADFDKLTQFINAHCEFVSLTSRSAAIMNVGEGFAWKIITLMNNGESIKILE